MKVYLDNAATTRVDEKVVEAMIPYLAENFGNPSSVHGFGRQTRAAIERARKQIADHLGASTGEIFFTSCGTESNNTIIRNAINTYGIKHAISSKIEHHAVLHPLQTLEQEGLIDLHYVDLDEKGQVKLQHLNELLSGIEDQVFVSLMHANNEIGNVLDIDAAGKICKEHKALFHSDTVQTVGHFTMNLSEINIDFITGSAHKFHGPKGAGFMYINADLKINPFIEGGAQERNMRAGTENVAGIMGFAAAMNLAYDELEAQSNYIRGLKDYFASRIKELFPKAIFNGEIGPNSLYTVLNVAFPPGKKTDMLMFNLDFDGIAVSGGSACSSGSTVGSHVIAALKLPEGYKPIRFSFSKFNTKEEIDFVIERLIAHCDAEKAVS